MPPDSTPLGTLVLRCLKTIAMSLASRSAPKVLISERVGYLSAFV